MKTSKWVVVLIASSLAMNVQAAAPSSGGTIRFVGLIYSPASASEAFSALHTPGTIHSEKIYPLQEARHLLPCDALDYFAAYAAKNSDLVAVTYN